MSRIGRSQIQIPESVTVAIENDVVTVKGEKGELSYETRPEINVDVRENIIEASIKIETRQSNAYWGLTRALIANMVEGVSKGFEKKLELVGVGYRVKPIDKQKISLAVGYSRPVEFKAPDGITLDVVDNKNITISGINKQLVGLTAAQIRKVRKPEPYKGKGIKYENEIIRRKPGKAGKVA